MRLATIWRKSPAAGLIAALAVPLAACTTSAQSGPDAAATSSPLQDSQRGDAVEAGRVIAQTHCAACHGVTVNAISPNPLSPPFERIVNTPGLDAATLTYWLDNSHNYPQLMNFEIAPEDVSNIAAYMLTLQHPDYRPMP